MHGPTTVGWLLVALCALTGASCLLRVRGARATQRRAAGSEALMGFGMAVMAVPASAVPAAPPAVFAVLFAAAAAWELVLAHEHRLARRETGHHVHHAVGALAMVYMALVMAQGTGGGAHDAHGTAVAPAGLPLLTGVLLAYFAVYVLRTGAQLLPAGAAGACGSVGGGAHGSASADAGFRDGDYRATGAGWAVRDEPGFALACRLAMGTGMLAMLVTL